MERDSRLAVDAAMVASVPLIDQLHELKREQHMRERAYPRFIAGGSLKSDAAARQMLRMDAAIATIEKLWRDESAAKSPALPLEAPAGGPKARA